jgi:hypothetical protein
MDITEMLHSRLAFCATKRAHRAQAPREIAALHANQTPHTYSTQLAIISSKWFNNFQGIILPTARYYRAPQAAPIVPMPLPAQAATLLSIITTSRASA